MSKSGINVVRTGRLTVRTDVTEIPESGYWLQLINGNTTKINTGPNGFQRLDKFIALAKKYNIYVPSVNDFPTAAHKTPLICAKHILGGMDAYVREFGLAKTHDEFFTHPEIQCKFYEYVQFLVSRYADEPGIIAWELANDARCSSTLDSSENCNANTVTKWHADTAKFVREHDPNHLIASGTHGFFCPSCPKLFPPDATGGLMTPSKLSQMIINERRAAPRALDVGKKIRSRWMAPSKAKRQTSGGGAAFNGGFGVDSEDILNAPDIDFGTFQLFPDQISYSTTGTECETSSKDFDDTLDQTVAWIHKQAQSARTIGKPLVLTAFGLVTSDNVQQFVPFTAMHPLVKSPHGAQKRQNTGTVGAGASQEQRDNAYSSWGQAGTQSGLGGVTQYQASGWQTSFKTFPAQGLATGNGTFVQSSNASASGTLGSSPNDGYGGMNQTQLQQVLANTTQSTP
ncbi:glycoside hydrolase superfamily [Russula brevipes]|nr:glycoside hydrolase superfamily [Russula brevipes]